MNFQTLQQSSEYYSEKLAEIDCKTKKPFWVHYTLLYSNNGSTLCNEVIFHNIAVLLLCVLMMYVFRDYLGHLLSNAI